MIYVYVFHLKTKGILRETWRSCARINQFTNIGNRRTKHWEIQRVYWKIRLVQVTCVTEKLKNLNQSMIRTKNDNKGVRSNNRSKKEKKGKQQALEAIEKRRMAMKELKVIGQKKIIDESAEAMNQCCELTSQRNSSVITVAIQLTS